jgi:hypothetical protein
MSNCQLPKNNYAHWSYISQLAYAHQSINITNVNWLMLFKEITRIYTENHTKPLNKNCRIIHSLKEVGVYSCHWVLKDKISGQIFVVGDKFIDHTSDRHLCSGVLYMYIKELLTNIAAGTHFSPK